MNQKNTNQSNEFNEEQSENIETLPLAQPESDQQYLRMLETELSVCTESKRKLSILLEYCNTGLTIIENEAIKRNNEDLLKEADELRKEFIGMRKNPRLVSEYLANDSLGKGMYYSIKVGGDNSGSTFDSAENDNAFNLTIAKEFAYEAIASPFFDLKLKIRSLLKAVGVIVTYDILGEMQRRIQEMSNMSRSEREELMKYVPAKKE